MESGTLSSSLQRPENLSYGWFWNTCEWIARKWQSRTPTRVYLTSEAKGCALPKCRELLVFPTELESSAVPQKRSTSTLVQHSLGRSKVTKDQTALVHPGDFIYCLVFKILKTSKINQACCRKPRKDCVSSESCGTGNYQMISNFERLGSGGLELG